MKGYVGVVTEIPESVAVGERCVESGTWAGVDVVVEPAVHKDFALDHLAQEGLKRSAWDESFSNVGAVIGNFVTQYRCWNHILESGEPGICLLYTSPSPRDRTRSRMPSSA